MNSVREGLDTIVKAPGKDETSLQNHFINTEKVFGDEWDLFSKRPADPFQFLKD